MSRGIQLRAPSRGTYDRALSRAERDAQHRERLLRASAEVLMHGTLTVARIVEQAGVGRSTFYEFFDSPAHLLEQLQQRALRALEAALEQALTQARTPVERIRAITRAWLFELEAHPIEAAVALRGPAGSELLSPAGKLLHQVLERSSRAARLDGVGGFGATGELSSLAAAAAIEVLSRRHVGAEPVRDAQRTLSDIMTRLLR
jgi:AcrR family transcriptional regulator